MKTLLKNGHVINVFTGEVIKESVLIENDKIIGMGNYPDHEADIVEDLSGKYICPGFIDSHIHIESTMLTPAELAKAVIPHGTTSIIADPHEIANVCGTNGISYMLEMSEGIPLHVYFMLPSCVPATDFDESAGVLNAKDLEPFYKEPRVLGLAEVMDYPGVITGDKRVTDKISDAVKRGKVVDGHAPLLSGKNLDRYISAGIYSDHECSSADEGKEKIRKGQWVMIRQGTAAKNLPGLIELFDQPFCHRCLLATDDRHPADLIKNGHIDHIIRLAGKNGKSVITAIQMATIQAAQYFGLQRTGAIAPGYTADILVLDDLERMNVKDVYSSGIKVVADKEMQDFRLPQVREQLKKSVHHTFFVKPLTPEHFYIEPKSSKCRVIKLIENELLTEEVIADINWDMSNGIDVQRDILKLAVIERHRNTGHIGLGFIQGIGMKKGAIASSVSHDSHNIIVIGTNDEDMAAAANRVCEMGGGSVVVAGKEILADMPLPVAGLMTDLSAQEIAKQNRNVREKVYDLGVPQNVEPFMTMAFVSLPVIPAIKMTTQGLVDVNQQKRVALYVI